MLQLCCHMGAISHMWPLSTQDVARVTEELIFLFCLILITFKSQLNVATYYCIEQHTSRTISKI